MKDQPCALTIAGFDPSGGAGVLADTNTFVALGCESMAVITSITYQNDAGVFGATHQTADIIREQLRPLLDRRIDAVKTGMLPTSDAISEVVRFIREGFLPAPVVDPVMISSSGQRLMEADALAALVSQLVPCARLLTPNISEAEALTGIGIHSEAEMRQAAKTLRSMGSRAVLVKGGHLESKDAIDVLDNEGNVSVFRAERVPEADLHGTGCRLSAAIAAGLAKRLSLENAVREAKAFVLNLIRHAPRD